MYGPYEENQNFLIETKFPSIVLNLLKVDSCPRVSSKSVSSVESHFIRIIESKLKSVNP